MKNQFLTMSKFLQSINFTFFRPLESYLHNEKWMFDEKLGDISSTTLQYRF